MDKSN